MKKQKRILLVEDEPLIALSQKLSLENYGYRVLTVHNGEAALSAVREKQDIELVLMDIDLGAGMDGTEAATQILREVDLPLVFLSSHTERDIVEKTEGISSYGYVVKSAGITVLDAAIKMAFRLFEAHCRVKEHAGLIDSLFDSIPDMIFYKDMEGVILGCNSAFARYMGLPKEKLIGKCDYDICSREDADYFRAMDRRVIEAGRKFVNKEELLFPDGSCILYEMMKTPYRDAEGRIIGVIGAGRDLSERGGSGGSQA